MTTKKYESTNKAMAYAKRLAAYKYMNKEAIESMEDVNNPLFFDMVWSGMLNEYVLYIEEDELNVLTAGTAKSTYAFLVESKHLTVEHQCAAVAEYKKKNMRFDRSERVRTRENARTILSEKKIERCREQMESPAVVIDKATIEDIVYQVVDGRVTRLNESDKLENDRMYNRTYVSSLNISNIQSVVRFVRALSKSYEGVVVSLSNEACEDAQNLFLEIEVYHMNQMNKKRWKGKSFDESMKVVKLNDLAYKLIESEFSKMTENIDGKG